MTTFKIGDEVEFIDTYHGTYEIGDRARVSDTGGDIVYLDILTGAQAGRLGHGTYEFRVRLVKAFVPERTLIGPTVPAIQPLVQSPVSPMDQDEEVMDASGQVVIRVSTSAFLDFSDAVRFAAFVAEAVNEKVERDQAFRSVVVRN